MYRISPQSFLHNPKGDLSVAQDIHFSQSNVFHFLVFLIFHLSLYSVTRYSSVLIVHVFFTSEQVHQLFRQTNFCGVPLASGEVGNWARLLLANRYMIFTRKCEYSLFSVLFVKLLLAIRFQTHLSQPILRNQLATKKKMRKRIGLTIVTAPPNEKPRLRCPQRGRSSVPVLHSPSNKSLSPAFFCVAYCSIPLGILRTSSTLMECSLLSRPHLLTRMRLRTSSTSPLGSQCEMLVRANAISAHLGSLYALHRNVVPSREKH